MMYQIFQIWIIKNISNTSNMIHPDARNRYMTDVEGKLYEDFLQAGRLGAVPRKIVWF